MCDSRRKHNSLQVDSLAVLLKERTTRDPVHVQRLSMGLHAMLCSECNCFCCTCHIITEIPCLPYWICNHKFTWYLLIDWFFYLFIYSFLGVIYWLVFHASFKNISHYTCLMVAALWCKEKPRERLGIPMPTPGYRQTFWRKSAWAGLVSLWPHWWVLVSRSYCSLTHSLTGSLTNWITHQPTHHPTHSPCIVLLHVYSVYNASILCHVMCCIT